MTIRSNGSTQTAITPGIRTRAPGVLHGAAARLQRYHPIVQLTTRALLVGVACYLTTEIVAINRPPLFVSPIWPTNAILVCALVATPVRYWWAYGVAGFFSSIHHNVKVGDPVSQVVLFLVGDMIEVFGAAFGVRHFAGGVDAFTRTRKLVRYLVVVTAATFFGAFVSAFAAPPGEYWVLWRSWFLGDATGYLTLAPAMLAVIASPRGTTSKRWRARGMESVLLATGVLITSTRLFVWPAALAADTPALMYLPVPFLVWASVRFGPRGVTACLASVTLLAMSGAMAGRGPFNIGTPADNAASLQLFLLTISPALMFVAVLVEEQVRSQEALRRSEGRYRAVVEEQTELICRFRPDGTCTFVNAALCRVFRRSAAETVGRRMWDFLAAEHHEATRQYLASITVDHPVASYEYGVEGSPGGSRWMHWTTRGFFDDRGVITEYQAVGRDITERKRAEIAARESESQLRSFIEHSPAAVAMFDRDMKYLVYSRRWLKDYDLADESLVGRSHYDVFPEVPDRWKDAHRRCLTGAVERCDQDEFVRRDGSVEWLRWETRPWRDVHGEIGGIILFTEVITERKRADEELRELESQREVERVLRASEARFRAMADDAPVLIWMADAGNRATYFNKPWLEFTGRSLDDQLDFGWTGSIHVDDLQQFLDCFDDAFAQRGSFTRQFRLRRHDGEYRWMLDNGVPYFGVAGTFSGYLGSSVDITSRKLAEEELRQAARRKDEFLAMLGHELRNPLAPIGMAIELLHQVPTADDSVLWARDVISRQLRQLTRLVDDLLDVSRITRGKIALKLEPVDLSTVVAQAIETSRPVIDLRGHQFLTTPLPVGAVWVRADAVRLGQVISNLLNNAARYTPDGGCIGLFVDVRGARVAVRVTDNGRGLSGDMLPHVFDLFWQAGSRDAAHGGLGIGLTLVKRLVDLHGGAVEARSGGLGQGSEFVVLLPVLDRTAAARTVTLGAPGRRLTRRRILVVDDNVDAAETLSRILRLEDQEVSVAYDGQAALELAGAIRPDIVFLDIELPKMNGLEVARRLRTEWPTSPLLLVAITGFGQEEDRRRTAAAGFDHHVVKPIDARVLRSLLASVA